MRVLVACEESGEVREAFAAKGHDAWSCDLQPSRVQGKHIQGSVLDVLNDDWDLLIGHPPCTYISNVGNRHWDNPGRARLRLEALDFFLRLWESDIPKICLENPRGCIDRIITKPTQVIQPYYFGDPFLKTTCLWLKNLPPLRYQLITNMFEERTATDYPEHLYTLKTNGKKIHWTEAVKGSKTRSKTFSGIANAMADQWG